MIHSNTHIDFFLGDCSSVLFVASSCALDSKNNGKLSQSDAPSSDMSDASDALDDFLEDALELLPTPPPMPLIDMPLTCKNDERRDCQPPGLDDWVSEHRSFMSFFRLDSVNNSIIRLYIITPEQKETVLD